MELGVATFALAFDRISPHSNETARGTMQLIIGGYCNSISILEFDPAARTLAKIYTTPSEIKLAAPTWLLLHHDTLYALQEWGANQLGEGIVTAFKIDREQRSLEFINQVRSILHISTLQWLIGDERLEQVDYCHVTPSYSTTNEF